MIRLILWCLCAQVLGTCCLASQPEPRFNVDGFRIPQAGEVLQFPRAHASHPEFRIEWWYLTGQLTAEEGRRFGWQATFFSFCG